MEPRLGRERRAESVTERGERHGDGRRELREPASETSPPPVGGRRCERGADRGKPKAQHDRVEVPTADVRVAVRCEGVEVLLDTRVRGEGSERQGDREDREHGDEREYDDPGGTGRLATFRSGAHVAATYRRVLAHR